MQVLAHLANSAKRAKVDETRIRCRQILIKHAGSPRKQPWESEDVCRTSDSARTTSHLPHAWRSFVRFPGAAGKRPTDVHRKPVKRSLEAAMSLALQTLAGLEKESAWPALCRQARGWGWRPDMS